MLKKINFSQPQSSRNTVMLKKFQSFKESAPGLVIDVRILEFLDFLSITVFREFQGWKFWNFLSITVFRDVQDRVCCITTEQ